MTLDAVGGHVTAPPLVLKRAVPGDRIAVNAMLAMVGLPVDGVADQFGGNYVLARDGSGLVGVAGVEVYGDWGLLRSVAVTPDAQGRGVGETLVRDRIGWARGRGLHGVVLLTTTAADFFVRFGFERIDRQATPEALWQSAEFASVCPETAVVMQLSLDDSGDRVTGSEERLRAAVRANYGRAALRVVSPQGQSEEAACCGPSCCGGSDGDPITRDLYQAIEVEGLPEKAVLASLGCGNPTALAELQPGETVLDLGSGGGIDVLLSARRVGPTGRAIGLDMTDEMLALARANQKAAGAENVEFLKGEIENVPLPDASVDVILSNCVINLSADKAKVLREAFRVLRPGGRFAVSDIVARGGMPSDVRHNVELWMGCVAGALEESEYRSLLSDAGFQQIEIEPTRVYSGADAVELIAGAGLEATMAALVDGRFMSAFVRAVKPA
jgi:SAM-dependent methyltransferase/N-acetylglutamate synthase-like GNAT family acetyltransferase